MWRMSSSAEMTLGIYTKLGRDDERDAIALLPELPTSEPDSVQERATGTDDAPESVASNVAFCPASQCSPVRQNATPTVTHDPETAPKGARSGGGGGSRTRVPEGARDRRLRA